MQPGQAHMSTRAQIDGMRKNGMSDTAIRRALSLSEAEAVSHKITEAASVPVEAGDNVENTPQDEPKRTKNTRKLTKLERKELRLRDAVRDEDRGWGFPVAIGDEFPVCPTFNINLQDIVKAAASAGEISLREIVGEQRGTAYSRPRQVAYLLAKQLIGASYPRIALAVGGRDHTTAMHGVKRAIELLSCDHEFQHLYSRTRAILGV